MPINPKLLKALLGAGVGGAAGYYALPHVSGYGDVESSRRLSGTMNAITGAIIGGLMHRPVPGGATEFSDLYSRLKPLQKVMLPATAIGSGELIPSILAGVQRSSGAMKDMANKTETSSIPFNVRRVLESQGMRGAGAGAGLAGLGALVSGLTRRQTEEELLNKKTRGGMVASDFLKYVVPAAIAGSVLGSFKQEPGV